MENNTSILILNELAHAKELLKQLESDLHAASPTNGKVLIPQILSYFENSLSMLSGIKSEAAGDPSLITGSETASTPTDSPRSVNGSPNKKRKTVPRWTEQIRACEKTGLEGRLDDGHSWRKYGQDVHGRGYYRCRNARGCLAKKKVQRSDEDPSIFSVTFRGRHTCIHAPNLLPGQSQNIGGQQDQKQTKSHGAISNLQTGRLGETEDFGASFSFPLPPLPIPCIEKENDIIFSSMTTDNHFMSSPLSSSYGGNNLEGGQNLQTSEYDLDELTSALDFNLDFDFMDSDFQFDL